MKHKIINKTEINVNHLLIAIELIAENESEITAIKNVANINATEEERELISNYLLFCLGDKYSVVDLNNQKQNYFLLKVFKN